MLKTEQLALDVLTEDPGSPASGEAWFTDNKGFGPVATQSIAAFMSAADKTKLDNMSANGSGDDWISGLLVEAQPSPDQTVKYAAGLYMVNGLVYSIDTPGNYDLENGYGGVNHYTALAASQRAIVLIYVDADEVVKSVCGTPTGDVNPPLPSMPSDAVCMSFVLISKRSNGTPNNINPPDLTDCRHARRPRIDEAVKISQNDTVSSFLSNKLVAGSNVTLTILNPGTNETYEISASGGGGNLDGGEPDTNFGGIEAIDGGTP